MAQDGGIALVAHTIQLAVAPVFLLSGVAGILAVLTNRLARVIDRGRTLETQLEGAPAEHERAVHAEVENLYRRARLIGHAITFCTLTALLVCSVVATLFIGAFVRFDASRVVAFLFVAAMVTLFVGLLSFLREIFVATAAMRIGPHGPSPAGARSARAALGDDAST